MPICIAGAVPANRQAQLVDFVMAIAGHGAIPVRPTRIARKKLRIAARRFAAGICSHTACCGWQAATIACEPVLCAASPAVAPPLATLDQGIILLPKKVIAEDVAAGSLRAILPEREGAPVPVYALADTRSLTAKTQLFIEFRMERRAK